VDYRNWYAGLSKRREVRSAPPNEPRHQRTACAELEKALLTLCAKIDDLGLKAAAAVTNGNNKRAGVLALSLVAEAARACRCRWNSRSRPFRLCGAHRDQKRALEKGSEREDDTDD
jgi:hypothetical protein